MFQNSSRQYASQLLFEVSPSKTYQRILVICVLLSLVAILNIHFLFPFFHIFLLIVLSYGFFRSVGNNNLCELHWLASGDWLIVENNQQKKASLCSGSVVTTVFAALIFMLENGQKKTVVIFKDNIDLNKFRQLRVRIKVEGIKRHDDIILQ